MDLITLEKIPIRIDWSLDKSDNYQVEIVMNTSDFFSSGTEIRSKIKDFKERYLKLIVDVKELSKPGQRKKASEYWNLSKLLVDFNKETENEFFITNYSDALARDLDGYNLSKPSLDMLFKFADYFTEDEILDTIPYANYRALVNKGRKLQKLNLFEQEKNRLLELHKKGKLPHTVTRTKDRHGKWIYKEDEYANQLDFIIKSASTKKMRSVKC